jgi:hypothetical protein
METLDKTFIFKQRLTALTALTLEQLQASCIRPSALKPISIDSSGGRTRAGMKEGVREGEGHEPTFLLCSKHKQREGGSSDSHRGKQQVPLIWCHASSGAHRGFWVN